MEIRTIVDDGKYTFVRETGDYRIKILRHGEPWVEIEAGYNAVLALMLECEDLRRRLFNGNHA